MKVELFMQAVDGKGGITNWPVDRKKALKANHYAKRFVGKDAETQARKFYDKVREVVRETGI